MDDQANKLSLESAKWTAEKLRELNNRDQLALINAHRRQDQATFNKILFKNLITNPDGIWQGLDDLNIQNSQGANIKIEPGKVEKEIPQRQSSALDLASMGTGIGLSILSRNANYNNFKKNSNNYAQQKAQQWKADQARKAKLLNQTQQSSTQQSPQLIPRPVTRLGILAQGAKKLPQGDSSWGTLEAGTNRAGIEEISPSWTRARTEEEAYQLALLEQYDRLAEISPASALEWAKKHNDPQIQQAIDRKRALDERLRKEWNSVFTQEQLNDPMIRAQIETGIKQRRRPGTQTSKGITNQTTSSVFTNAGLDSSDPNDLMKIKKILGKTNLSQRDLDGLFFSHSGRITEAERLIKRPLSPIERLALLRAHYTGLGEAGKAGGPAGIYNYSQKHIQQKTELLRSAGFNKEQRRQILESGLAGHTSRALPISSPPNQFQYKDTSSHSQENKNNSGLSKIQSLSQSEIKHQIARRIFNKFKNKLSNTKIGKRITRSRLGRRISIANKSLGKIKNAFNPIKYLTRLFARSLAGSVASAIGGIISTAIGALTSAAITIAGTAISIASIIIAKIATGIGITLSAVSLPVTIVAGLIFFLIILFFAIFFAPSNGNSIPKSPYAGISYSIVGPQTSPNGVDLRYDIIVLYDKEKATDPIENLSISASIPEEATLIPNKTTGTFKSSPGAGAIIWQFKNNTPVESGNQKSFSFTFYLRPQDDSTFDVSISILGATGGGGPPATGNSCSGKYNSVNAPKGNFGDPSCNYTLNDFGNELKSKDPKNYRFWYLLSECESGHRPNAYFRCNSDGSVCTPDPKGAWGAFQMGSNRNPLAYNRGNVEWKEQIQVAVDREKIVLEPRNLDFDYWQCETNVCRGAPELCTNGEYNTIR